MYNTISKTASNIVVNSIWNKPMYYQTTKPINPIEGDMYYNSNNCIEVYSNKNWFEVTYKFKLYSNIDRKNKINRIFI